MAAARRLDREAALEQIMRAFWERGYEATSIDDLEAATGLKRGSLYHAFGDKAGMYKAALARYRECVDEPIRAVLDDPDPRRAISRFLEAHLAALADRGRPPGCLTTNACLEADRTPVGAGRDSLLAAETALCDALRRAQAAGTIAPGRDLRALARFFVGVVRGAAVVHRATGDVGFARDILREALARLDVEA